MNSVARMIPFRARAPKNDLVEARAISFGFMKPSSGLLVDLVRRKMSSCTTTKEEKGYIEIMS